MRDGYVFHIDGPLSLFSATTKYGLQVALFLPALLHCSDFRIEAELRWGPKREPRSFLLEPRDGLVSHQADSGTYTPVELKAFVERFRQVAPAWEISESYRRRRAGPGRACWVPDYRLVHTANRSSMCSSMSSVSGRRSSPRAPDATVAPRIWTTSVLCWRFPKSSRSMRKPFDDLDAYRSSDSKRSQTRPSWRPSWIVSSGRPGAINHDCLDLDRCIASLWTRTEGNTESSSFVISRRGP